MIKEKGGLTSAEIENAFNTGIIVGMVAFFAVTLGTMVSTLKNKSIKTKGESHD